MTHKWKRVTTCLNGPHLWKCEGCGEWTRSKLDPKPDALLRDPETGLSYNQEPDSPCRGWFLIGRDSFSNEEYNIPGTYETEDEAKVAAEARRQKLLVEQPNAGSGFGNIRDTVRVERE